MNGLVLQRVRMIIFIEHRMVSHFKPNGAMLRMLMP